MDDWPAIRPEDWIIVPHWDEFQHYHRGRNLIWIKNYTQLLQNPEYLALSMSARGLLHGVWLAYGARRGLLQVCSLSVLTRSKRMLFPQLISLNHAGFIELSASKPLAQNKEVEVDIPQTPFTESVEEALFREAHNAALDWKTGPSEEWHARLDALEREFGAKLSEGKRMELWEMTPAARKGRLVWQAPH